MGNRKPRADVPIIPAKEPEVIAVSPTSIRPPERVCTHERTETYEGARTTDGVTVEIWRCIDCGAHQVYPKEPTDG